MSAFSIQSQILKSSFKKVYPGRPWFISKPNFKIQSSGMCECPFLARGEVAIPKALGGFPRLNRPKVRLGARTDCFKASA